MILMLLAIAPIIHGACHNNKPTKTSSRGGYFYYDASRTGNCKWTLSRGWPRHNMLIIDLKNISMETTTQDGRKTIGGDLMLPETGGITTLGTTNCYVYMLSSAECNVSASRDRVKSAMDSCGKYFLFTDIEQLPWNRSISLQSFRDDRKYFAFYYTYERCVESKATISPTSRKRNIIEPQETLEEASNISYPVVVGILAVLFAVSLGVILWTQFGDKMPGCGSNSKILLNNMNQPTNHQLNTPLGGDAELYHFAVDPSTSRREASPTYTDIDDAIMNREATDLDVSQNRSETTTLASDLAPPIYATVHKG